MENHEIVPHKKNELLSSNKSLEKRGLDLIKDLSGSSQTNTGQLDLSKTIINETALQTNNDLVISLGRGENMVFKYIPAGEFLMGGVPETISADNDNQPFHKVFLDEYWIGKYPVTIQQYSVFIKETNYRSRNKEGYFTFQSMMAWHDDGSDDGMWSGEWEHPLGEKSSTLLKLDHPVTWVSWNDAVEFCKWASALCKKNIYLPTEAQWEKAARGTDGRIYPWGNDTNPINRCNLRGFKGWDTPETGYGNDTTPVGKFSPQGDSPFGCADLLGNIYEWCADFYDRQYYSEKVYNNPRGPLKGKGDYRVQRGGIWCARWTLFDAENETGLSVVEREANPPDFINYMSGFRCAINK